MLEIKGKTFDATASHQKSFTSKPLEIKGLQKTSLIDYPGRVSAVVFLGGCNFRCPYCFNRGLVLNPEKIKTIPEQEILAFLESRKKWLDGLVIGGGEPTLHPGLPAFLTQVKALNLQIALETNGTNPEILRQLIKENLLDYPAMDLKAPLEKYEQVVRTKVDQEAVRKSIGLIIKSGLDHEFRSTILPALHTKQDILSMAKTLQEGKIYYLQAFRPGQALLNPRFQKERAFTPQEMEAFRQACSTFIKTELRV
jgi:pyruvate formate lyase activating enzyme